MGDTLLSLRRQLDEAEENLRLVQQRIAEYVNMTDIPLQLRKQEKQLQDTIADLQERLARLSETTPAAQPGRQDGTQDPLIHLLAEERSCLTEHYTRAAESANRIDIIALTMQALLENYGDDRLIDWLMEGKEIRILVLSPSSLAAKIRGKEEGIDLKAKIKDQITRLKRGVYNKAKRKIASGRKCSGLLEVRRYDGIPYFAYFGTEEAMIIGLYYSHVKGLQSEAISVGAESRIFKKMQGHFDTLWNGQKEGISPEDRVICRITESGSYFIDL